MISVIMRVYDVTNGYAQFFIDESAHSQRFFWKSQRVDHNGPLGTSNHTGCYLGVYFALKPVHIFRDAFAMHNLSWGVQNLAKNITVDMKSQKSHLGSYP